MAGYASFFLVQHALIKTLADTPAAEAEKVFRQMIDADWTSGLQPFFPIPGGMFMCCPFAGDLVHKLAGGECLERESSAPVWSELGGEAVFSPVHVFAIEQGDIGLTGATDMQQWQQQVVDVVQGFADGIPSDSALRHVLVARTDLQLQRLEQGLGQLALRVCMKRF